jgi:carboxylesterase type B
MDITPSPPIPTGRTYSEDCLLLNIWAPDEMPPSSGFPVLFFIHGGWLQTGNPHHDVDKEPSDLIASVEDGGAGLKAIVVCPGYRLGIIGFLSSTAMPEGERGNFGFYDQRLALEWTHRNISAFGGNADNITLAGFSAGAHSAHSQALYEYNLIKIHPRKPLFRQLFLQSNAAMLPAKTIKEASEGMKDLLDTLGINRDPFSTEALEDLRTVDASKLIEAIPKLNMHTFRAVRGKGEFVNGKWSSDLLKGGFARWCKDEKIQVLIGECLNEEQVYRLVNAPKGPNYATSLRQQLHNYYSLAVVDELIKCYSLPSSSDKDDWADVFGQAASDSQIYASERLFVDLLLQEGVSVLRYQIAYRPDFLNKYTPTSMGVGHSFDNSLWWFCKAALLEPEHLKEADKQAIIETYRQWLSPYISFIRGDTDAYAQWYGSQADDAAVKAGRAVRRLTADMNISVEEDVRWQDKVKSMKCLRQALQNSVIPDTSM